jgi:hypothetical protein
MNCNYIKRGSYPDELYTNNKNHNPDKNKELIDDKKNVPRKNEFLRHFCLWRKSQGLFVPVTWEK